MPDRAPRVRRAEPGDAEAIVRVMREVQAVHVTGRPDIFKPGGTENAAETRDRMRLPDNFMWVATLDGTVVGYAYGRLSADPENRWKFAPRTFTLDQMGSQRGAPRPRHRTGTLACRARCREGGTSGPRGAQRVVVQSRRARVLSTLGVRVVSRAYVRGNVSIA